MLDLAGFVFAAGLMAFVFSYLYRRLEGWGIALCSVNAGDKWALRLSGVALMVASWALFSYSLSASMTGMVPASYSEARWADSEDLEADMEETDLSVGEPDVEALQPMTYLEPPVAEWLSLMDAANYQIAWTWGAQSLQRSFSADEFARLAESLRKPLGGIRSRVPVTTVDLSALPDGREGIFKLYIYRTTFASGAEFEETVVAEVEADDWKILNYNLGRIAKNPRSHRVPEIGGL